VCDEARDSVGTVSVWYTTGCDPGACIELAGEEPFCAEATEPDPRCDTDVDGSLCDGELFVSCVHGYAGNLTDCSAEGLYCVEVRSGRAQCAVEREPNPVCGSGVDRTCDGDALVRCKDGYVVERQDCRAAGEYCVVDGIDIGCRVSTQPDPRCPPSVHDTVCDGELLISCISGYIDSREPCPSGQSCKLSDCEFCDPNYLRGKCAAAE
jgi:hypothetical protein